MWERGWLLKAALSRPFLLSLSPLEAAKSAIPLHLYITVNPRGCYLLPNKWLLRNQWVDTEQQD